MQRPKPAAHDESPSAITDHPFEPKGEWYSLCGYFLPGTTKRCNLAESAHTETKMTRCANEWVWELDGES